MKYRIPALRYVFSTAIVILIIWSCADKKNSVAPSRNAGNSGLIVSLDSTLDRFGTIKVDSFASAFLADTLGANINTATIANGKAQFDLTGIASGDYFITINELTRDRIPTRIPDSAQNILQSVGKTLRSSLIMNGIDTLYRIETFFGSRGENPVRKYSDGTNVSPEEFAYAIMSLRADSEILEIRVDSSAALLMSFANPNDSIHTFTQWMLGESNHGLGPGGDPDSTSALCQECHSNFDMKPMRWMMINSTRGLCFKCHYGSGGPAAGMIDPNQ